VANTSGIVWDVSPAVLAGNLGDYATRLRKALGDLADFFAAKLEAFAKLHAPWVDRSSNARQSLRAFAIKTAASIVIYLVHGVAYGKYLELGTTNEDNTERMAPRPIIMPTLEAHYGEIMAATRRLVAA
jgi:hypothetical protein